MLANQSSVKRVFKEIQVIKLPSDIVMLSELDQYQELEFLIQGPDQTPFEKGWFKMKMVMTPEYPQQPPKCWFLTKIFHPNVSSRGEICVNTLKKDWHSQLGILDILLTIKSLLMVPNAESALNEEAGKLLLENYDSYYNRAKMMTQIHSEPAHVQTNTENEIKNQNDKRSNLEEAQKKNKKRSLKRL